MWKYALQIVVNMFYDYYFSLISLPLLSQALSISSGQSMPWLNYSCLLQCHTRVDLLNQWAFGEPLSSIQILLIRMGLL